MPHFMTLIGTSKAPSDFSQKSEERYKSSEISILSEVSKIKRLWSSVEVLVQGGYFCANLPHTRTLAIRSAGTFAHVLVSMVDRIMMIIGESHGSWI